MMAQSVNILSDFKDTSKKDLDVKQPNIGLYTTSSFILGAIIGAGIFVSPAGVLRYSGSLGGAIIIWCCSGVIATMGALCYSELGTMFPQSGCDYIYIRTCFGGLPAFLFMWTNMVIFAPLASVIKALIFANYILEPFFSHCTIPQDGIRLIAAFIICLLTYINCRNVTWVARVQESFTFAKVSALVIIIITGVFHLFSGRTTNFENAFEGTTRQPGYIALAFYSGMFSYSGWNYLNFVTEELKDPDKNLPRAVYISLPLVTVIYVLTNVAYFSVLIKHEILSSNAVAVTFGENILGFMSWIMPVSVALSTFGGLNAAIFAFARLFSVGARAGHLPSFLSMIHFKYLTPTPSLIFLCLMSLMYLTTTDVYILINYGGFIEAFFVTISTAGLIWLRYRKPKLKRPIKVPLILSLIFLATYLFLITFPFYGNPRETGMALAIILPGIPVYVLTISWKRKPKFYRKFIGKLTVFIQKILLCIPEK